jgi:hypothetical protein
LNLVAFLNFSYDRPNWSSASFSNTPFQNSPGISDLLSTVSNFQTHTELCSKCSTLLVSSLNLSPVCWWRESSWLMLFLHDSPGFNFSCTSWILCYHATQIFEIFHILQLFWSIIICTGDCSLQSLITFFFPH